MNEANEAAEKLQKFLEKEGIIIRPIPRLQLRDDGSYSIRVDSLDVQFLPSQTEEPQPADNRHKVDSPQT